MVRRFLGDDCAGPVREAMRELPRHWFVPAQALSRAYDDVALPIGGNQTISQPRVVAQMLTQLALRPGMTVLDVGAGSGYATMLMGRLVAPGRVLAIERQAALLPRTRALLETLGAQVQLQLGDGQVGDPGGGLFDAIHVACAFPQLPPALLRQLAPEGRLVLPLGPHGGTQRLTVVVNDAQGLRHEDLGAVMFVPGLPGVEAAGTGSDE